MIFFYLQAYEGDQQQREKGKHGHGEREEAVACEMLILSSVEVRSKLFMCVRKLNSGKDNTYLPCTQLQLHTKNITRQFLL